MRRQLLIIVAVLLLLSVSTVVVILYGMGYRFGFQNGKIGLTGTGLLVTTSVPDGAEVLINGHLTTATNNTINLAPGEYDVKIQKEGYFSWEKHIKIRKEEVSKADALLFPQAPKLDSITSNGVQIPSIDPTMTKLAFITASQSALKKNGIYVLDMSGGPVNSILGNSTQVADDTVDRFSQSTLLWSPDGKELLASLSATQTMYLLDSNRYNSTPQDVTATLESVYGNWNVIKKQQDTAKLTTVKPALRTLLKDFTILNWSPDETKILYTASESATLPIVIKPRLIGANSTPEQRQIKQGQYYVYDIKEDRNYAIPVTKIDNPEEKDPMVVRWFGDSNHLIYVHDKKIDLMDYDGLNQTTVYAGPFIGNYVFPWPTGTKIVILTNLGNEMIMPNLYTIGIR